jgi:hypothetical protein
MTHTFELGREGRNHHGIGVGGEEAVASLGSMVISSGAVVAVETSDGSSRRWQCPRDR